MDNKFKFQVIMELKEDLNTAAKEEAEIYIKKWADKFEIDCIDGNTYFKRGADKTDIDRAQEFGSVSFFYANMLDIKKYFKKLEYYDFVDKEFDYAVS